MVFVYVILALAATPVALGAFFCAWTQLHRWFPAFFSVVLVAMLAGCDEGAPEGVGGSDGGTTTTTTDTGGSGGADSGPVSDASSCSLPAGDCPSGAQEVCPLPYGSTVTCCKGSDHVFVCDAPAGIIVSDSLCDAACPSKVCAISPMGTRVCCNPDAPNGGPDPCKTAVP